MTFIDSDDWIEKDALQTMVERQTATDADIVQIDYYRTFGVYKKKSKSPLPNMTIRQPELFEKYYISFFGLNILNVSIWGKLYRTSLILEAGISPSGFKMGEDLIFNLKLFPHIQSYHFAEYTGYNYRYGGVTSKYNPNLLPDLKCQYIYKKECMKRYGYDKAFQYAAIEMRNILQSEIYQQIVYIGNRATICSNISKELQDDVWNDMQILANEYPDKRNDIFIKSIIDKNTAVMYEYVNERVEKDRWKIRAKNIISKVVN